MNDSSVSVAKIAQILDLKNFTDNIDLKKIKITSSDVNRPALQLTGYFAHFEQSRIQMIGNVEYAYIQQMSDEEKRIRYSAFYSLRFRALFSAETCSRMLFLLNRQRKIMCRFLEQAGQLPSLWQN